MDEYIYSLPPPPPPKRKYNESITNVEKKLRNEFEDDVESSDQALIETMKKASQNIDEWIAQRKKNWPTNKRIEEKLQEKSITTASKPKNDQINGSKRICKYYASTGSCKMGQKCKFSHQKLYKRFEAPSKGSLFKKLVQSDMKPENELILQAILQFKDKGWLD